MMTMGEGMIPDSGEGDEAKCSDQSFGFHISQRDGELRASKRRGIPIDNNGGGDLFRIWIL